MQELGEALVNLLDLYSIEYVVGLGEGAGANILARCADNKYRSIMEYSIHLPGSGWRIRQDVWDSF